jgi:dihydroxyacetone kinase
VKTIGFALSSCTVPAKGTPTFKIDEDEMEYGIGIHGEPGICREKIISADEIAKRAVDALLDELSIIDNDKQEIAILINGLGGSPIQELYVLNYSVRKILDKKGIKVAYTLVGNYMTSIDMMGASISILRLDKELKELLFYPCNTPALHIDGFTDNVTFLEYESQLNHKEDVSYELETNEIYSIVKDDYITMENIIFFVDKMSECIIKNEVLFCE